MNVVVNGQSQQIPESATVAELLSLMKFPLRGVAVEVNLVIVPRQRHAEHQLQDGDRLEVVSLVGGG